MKTTAKMAVLVIISIVLFRATANSNQFDYGSITGKIYSINTGEPVPYAAVEVVGTMLGSVSNEDGEYIIMNIPAGEYMLKVSLLGYREIVQEMNVVSNVEENNDLFIKEIPIPMAGVEVKGKKSDFEYDEEIGQGERVNLALIGSRPGMVDDILRQVQELPQVKARSDYSAKMYIRGSGPEHNIVYIDGVPAYNPYRAFGVVSSFNSDLVESVRLYPGGFPAEFGGRLSAVLDIDYKRGSKKKLKPSLDINALAAGAIIEGPLSTGNSAFIISARRTYYDILLNQSDSKTAYPHFYDLNGKFSYGLNTNNQFDIMAWHNGEGFRLTQNQDVSDDRSYNARAENYGYSNAVSIDWQHISNSSLAFDHKVYYVNEDRNLDMTGDIGAEFISKFHEASVQGEALYFNPIGQFKTGYLLSYGREKVDWDGYNFPDSLDEERPPDSPDVRPIQEHFHFNGNYFQWAAFTSSEIGIHKNWSIMNGYRLSGGGLTDHLSLSPRWGLAFQPSNYMRVSYSGGIYFQPPTYKAFMEKNYLPELERNPGIKPERAMHHIIDFGMSSEKGWNLEMSVYRKSLDRLIFDGGPVDLYVAIAGVTSEAVKQDEIPNDLKNEIGMVHIASMVMGQNSVYPDNCGEGTVHGFELSLIRNSESRLNGNIFYSLSESKLKTPLGEYHPNYDQRHTFTTGLDCRLSSNWAASTHYRYGSGFPYTDVIGRKEGANAEDIPWVPLWADVNQARYPYYSRLDLRLTYKFKWAESDWKVYIEGINILNRKNVYAYTYDRDYITRRSIEQLPLLPNFGISVNF
ncbi:MAG: TonB-dependent receptor [candidate division Zixibacteria bacterium]|nr:TonB-dependent receptor [candidate division Zixibacteria bacterium]